RVWAFINNDTVPSSIFKRDYDTYFNMVKSNMQEPLITNGDHYNSFNSYQAASYFKGSLFLAQLGYIVGGATLDRILLEYYKEWRFKHPNPTDFIRVAEKVSKVELGWYGDFWINSNKTIDYSIDSLWEEGGKSKIRLRMIGKMPMPIDVLMQFKDGSRLLAYIPLYSMFGSKPLEDKNIDRLEFEPWRWTQSTYVYQVDRKLTDLKVIEIDPTQRMADVNRANNKLELNW
ncbi:MAG TPA: M1 family peptidase, partial [Puia sp.]|nr:M1 family peptidase [Puia sp.]